MADPAPKKNGAESHESLTRAWKEKRDAEELRYDALTAREQILALEEQLAVANRDRVELRKIIAHNQSVAQASMKGARGIYRRVRHLGGQVLRKLGLR